LEGREKKWKGGENEGKEKRNKQMKKREAGIV
jgi:hypothetical protein